MLWSRPFRFSKVSSCQRSRRFPSRLSLELLESRLVPAVLPDGFSEVQLAEGLVQPAAMALAPDGRVFVAEQDGTLRVIKDGQLLDTPFHKVNASTSGPQRGLVGIAFDPAFASNGYVYVHYTANTLPRHNRVSRLTADPENPDVALPGSESTLFQRSERSGTNHAGGAIHFGLDDKLYISVGDDDEAQGAFAQDLASWRGKILRLNSDGSIPEDNPFVDVPGAQGEIYALGLRNPYTFDVQPGTGRIFLNDVGSTPPQARERIYELQAGGNYGWPIYEGYSKDPKYLNPLYAYPSGIGDGTCAIVGGSFYNPTTPQFPKEYEGTYFFSDLCAGWIKRFNPDDFSVTTFATRGDPHTTNQILDLKVSPDGTLYYLSRGAGFRTGVVYAVSYNGSAPSAKSGILLTFEIASVTTKSGVAPLAQTRPSLPNTRRRILSGEPSPPGQPTRGEQRLSSISQPHRPQSATFWEPDLFQDVPLIG